MKTLCVRCHISGRVQGVGFRYATAEKAWSLGIQGYVRNLTDRRVEVLAYGEEGAVKALRHWLEQGPPLAHVHAVHCETIAPPELRDFQIL